MSMFKDKNLTKYKKQASHNYVLLFLCVQHVQKGSMAVIAVRIANVRMVDPVRDLMAHVHAIQDGQELSVKKVMYNDESFHQQIEYMLKFDTNVACM